MINTNKKSAFTLVELIVVITILAILATIAFISLQGYSADARNSKVTSDLNSIQGSITTKVVEGVPLLSFVTANVDRDATTTPSIGGANTDSGSYLGGTTNFQVLGAKDTEFQDPSSEVDYSLGATTRAGGVFELAGKIVVDSVPTAKVKGTYNPRTAAAITFKSFDVSGSKITLENADVNKFKANDTVNITGGTTEQNNVVISKVSRDGLTLTISTAITASSDNDTVTLAATEVGGLTGDSATGGDGIVTNNDTVDLPY